MSGICYSQRDSSVSGVDRQQVSRGFGAFGVLRAGPLVRPVVAERSPNPRKSPLRPGAPPCCSGHFDVYEPIGNAGDAAVMVLIAFAVAAFSLFVATLLIRDQQGPKP